MSHLITAVPGSSAYYIGGVVSYANAVKMEELGIPSDMLELNGAVSQPVVETHGHTACARPCGPTGASP